MLVSEGHDNTLDLPYVDQRMPDGTIERRYLASLRTPDDHPMMSAPYWLDANPDITPIPKARWRDYAFERYHGEVPILDQDGKGACEAFSWATQMMLAIVRAGEPYVALSPWHLYSLINGGRDAGSNAGDAVQALIDHGIAEASLVPGQPIRPAGINDAAVASALNHRMGPAYRIPAKSGDDTVGQVLTAIVMGWNVSVDVQAGGGYNTNGDGVIGFLGGFTNHAQTVGEGLSFDANGSPLFNNRNSWGVAWGVKGCGKLTTRHILASQEIWVCRRVLVDPRGGGLPPALV